MGSSGPEGTPDAIASSSVHPGRSRWSTTRRISTACFILACILGVSVWILAGPGRPSPTRPATSSSEAASRAVPVVTAAVRRGDVNVFVTALGSVVPLNTVTVRSRVDGQLMAVHFKEGDLVNRGDPLAEIDPRPFEVQLTQAEGQMAKDKALLDNAHRDLERYQLLYTEDSISRQLVDTQESLVRQLEGTVKADQGQIDSAQLQLAYCRLAAPISGRAGLRLVDPGNIVHASDAGGLVVITQLQPIGVLFAIPEDSLPAVLAKLRQGEHAPVEAYDREQTHRLASGSLVTTDNQIDPGTGTVKLKAAFPNTNNELFPNQFVNARLLLDVERAATIVPVAAVQRGAQGSFVYVVKPEGTVAVRQIGVGVTQGDDVAVTTGLRPGELVVVDGADRLRDGSSVQVRQGATSRPRNS